MNLREIGFIRTAVYVWRNIQNRRSFKHGKNNVIENGGGRKLIPESR